MADWSIADSDELYRFPGWGLGVFRINEAGHLSMRPSGDMPGPAIDLKKLVDDMRRRGVELPLLVRFTDVIAKRLDDLVGGFQSAMAEWDYAGKYRPVYPIKVNPQSYVMRDILRHGAPHHVGLEAGSKPELMVVLAQLEDPEALIICNGYKDAQYIRLALLARNLGHECVIVLEKPDELDIVLRLADELGVDPVIGVRARLDFKGTGHWAGSTGDHAKFGLSIAEIVATVERLKKENRLSCLQLLHFHIGSQISTIRSFRGAIREGARIYGELARMGAPMRFIDVGGGLGIDYDGTGSTEPSSINYDIREYANTVVGTIREVCDEMGAAHPDIVTESGRAMVAHHSVLLLDVVGHTCQATKPPERPAPEPAPPRVIEATWEIYDELHPDRLIEAYHDIEAQRREAINRFNLGLLDLTQRAYVERMYWATCSRILEIAGEDYESNEIDQIRESLSNTYFCNFSVFQSLPDIWAIDQLFPIAPIHRLDEEPTERAILADLTCDSDGKINRFIAQRDTTGYLDLHALKPDEHYVIGVFLVGAYQEILGDLHNLFGDTHAIHVAVADNRRGYAVLHLDEGDIIEEVLTYVHHRPKELIRQLRGKVELATEEGHMSIEDGAAFIQTFVRGLDDYTYLTR